MGGTSSKGFSELERGAWGGLLAIQGGLLRRVEEDLEQNSQLGHPEFEVLLRLSWQRDSGVRVQDLAERSLLTRSGISRVIERLERKGLVERVRAAEDGRGSYAVLTEAGAQRIGAAAAHHIRFVRSQFLSHFTDEELTTLGALLARANDPSVATEGSA